jgi:hypothetical protein
MGDGREIDFINEDTKYGIHGYCDSKSVPVWCHIECSRVYTSLLILV